MDNNEIPPYDMDMPFNNNEGNNGEDNKLFDDNGGEELDLSDTGSEDLLSESLAEDFGVDLSEEEQYVQNPDVKGKQNNNTAAQAESKQKGNSIIVLVGVVMLLVMILLGTLIYIYADNLIAGKSEASKVKTIELNDEASNTLNNIDSDANVQDNSIDADFENAEGTGVEITRENRRHVLAREGNNPYLTEDENAGMQKNEIATARYYTKGKIGRLDPFNPSSGPSNELFEIIVPPVDPTPDPETQALMSLKITGIMYTPDSPSAIINIAGQDQLVRKGDKFNGFSVENIGKDKVTVKAGANVYTASVGEILNVEQVGVNSIPNLNKKFAGPYYKGKEKFIEINMID